MAAGPGADGRGGEAAPDGRDADFDVGGPPASSSSPGEPPPDSDPGSDSGSAADGPPGGGLPASDHAADDPPAPGSLDEAPASETAAADDAPVRPEVPGPVKKRGLLARLFSKDKPEAAVRAASDIISSDSSSDDDGQSSDSSAGPPSDRAADNGEIIDPGKRPSDPLSFDTAGEFAAALTGDLKEVLAKGSPSAPLAGAPDAAAGTGHDADDDAALETPPDPAALAAGGGGSGWLDDPPRKSVNEDELLADIDSLFDPPEEPVFPGRGEGGGRGEPDYDEASFLDSLDYLLDPEAGPGLPPRDPGGDEFSGGFDDDDPEGPGAWPASPDDETEMGRLRRLIIDREMTQLSYFSRVLTDPANHAHALSEVVTEAILLRSRRDDKLNTVLGPTVEKIFGASVRRNPETLANSIFPVIGPAIRRSISETFTSMLQNFNSTLEKSLSLQGLKWRLEAFRVRKPFSEIVLLHTLLYHVEEIYLIHAASGLVLDHLVSEGSEGRDSDLVAGMFTAIQDFARDSFSTGGERGESLDNLRFGERTIYLRRADPVYMACVVRGNPPTSLVQDLQEALELFVVDCAEDLDDFKGDTKAFQKCRVYFEDFLKVRYQEPSRKLPLLVRLLPLAVVLLMCFAFVFSYRNGRVEEGYARGREAMALDLARGRGRSLEADQARFEEALDILRREPGLVVGHVGQILQGGPRSVVVLKDNLARDPGGILSGEGGLDPSRYALTVKPYVSLDEDIVQQRVRDVIDPLPTVTMEFDGAGGVLKLAGSAPMGWILETREKALSIPGVVRIDAAGLTDPRTMAMESLVAAINGVVIHFPTNSDEPVPEDAPVLAKAVDNLVALERLAAEMQMGAGLVIYGHADATGSDRRNFELSEQRTKTLAAMLYARGSSMPISNYGLGSQFSAQTEEGPPQEDAESRKIELNVRLSQGGLRASEGAD
ncbi:MAG: hypothetical protein LBO05_13570 [Deltaproteobacteria bacterium]|nr:hypothetical protein [Deltaproteobacteria bacterium]